MKSAIPAKAQKYIDLFKLDLQSILSELALQNKIEISAFRVVTVLPRPKSVVFKISLSLPKNLSRTVYMKTYIRQLRDEVSDFTEQEFQAMGHWYALFSAHPQFAVIHPLYYDHNRLVIITEEFDGINLGTYIEKASLFYSSANLKNFVLGKVKMAGQWLAWLHGLKSGLSDEPLRLEQITGYVEERLDRLIANPGLKLTVEFKTDCLHYLEKEWNSVRDGQKYQQFIHSDFTLNNIMFNSRKMAVLDFQPLVPGPVFKDVSRFCHQIELLRYKPIFSKLYLDHLKEAFLDGYGQPGLNRNPLFKIYYLTHAINHLGKTARYWEHRFDENLYNRWLVFRILRESKKTVGEGLDS